MSWIYYYAIFHVACLFLVCYWDGYTEQTPGSEVGVWAAAAALAPVLALVAFGWAFAQKGKQHKETKS